MNMGLLTIIFLTIIFTVLLMVLLLFFKQMRYREYNEREHRAQLELLRDSFERQIYGLTERLLSTETRWKDINHLLISVKNAEKAEVMKINKVFPTEFLGNFGILDENLEIDPKMVFILTPFNEKYQAVFETIRGVCNDVGLICYRGDEENITGDIFPHILRLLVRARIVIANLDGRNPNVFYELGIAHAMDKQTILISKLTGELPFDLKTKRMILYRDISELKNMLQSELTKALVKSSLSVSKMPSSLPAWDQKWISENSKAALSGLRQSNKTTFMEIRMTLLGSRLNVNQKELLQLAEQAAIHTFGWPIGVVLLNRPEFKPRPKSDGIVAEITPEDKEHYDYWALRKDGMFYLLKSLFEDIRRPGYIFFNIRIVRITEVLLYAERLYSGFGIPPNSRILIGIRHGGLKNRILSSSSPNRELDFKRTAIEDEIYTEVETTLSELHSHRVEIVEKFTQPLFLMFDFFELNREVLADIVNKYVNGEVS